jgi:hypothetical protein
LEIEKNIPLTDGRGIGKSPKRPLKYPWPDLEVDDSFRADVKADVLRASASKYGKAHGKKFVVRVDGDGARAWRVS